MLEFNKKGPDPINSMIGEGTTVIGEIKTTSSLYVNGKVEGKIAAENDVFIAEKGKVAGNVAGEKIVVSGEIDGDVTAKKVLEISKTGKVNGEITCDKLLIETGARYQGKVNVGKAPGTVIETKEQESVVETTNV